MKIKWLRMWCNGRALMKWGWICCFYEYSKYVDRLSNCKAVGEFSKYRVSQEECARLREGVPYVKVYRYNPKHLRPKLNGYGDNRQRKVWYSGGSTHCTCQLITLSMPVLECGVILRQFRSSSLQTVYVIPSW